MDWRQTTKSIVVLQAGLMAAVLLWAAGCGPRKPGGTRASFSPQLKQAFSPSELGSPIDPSRLSAPDRALLRGLTDGNATSARQSLAAGANPNLDCGHGCKPLMLAAGMGDAALVDALRKAGATETPDAQPYLDVLEFPARAAGDDYKAALAEAEKLAGNALTAQGTRGDFRVELGEAEAQSFVDRHQATLLAKGCFAFISEMHFGIGGKPDTVTFLPTRDKFAVMVYRGVNGIHYDIDTHLVLKWMRRLDGQYPYVLHGCGTDFLSGRFVEKIPNPRALAEAMYAFCPDIVDQGTVTIEELTNDLERRNDFYFWWEQ